jgi:phosphatidylserine/phosphatidylglycerophosphate/cardiolipin synthase-like enzyme
VRIYLRGTAPDLARGLLGLLVDALDAEPGDVWLISPWLREVELPVPGHFASVFGGHRDQVPLTELLGRAVQRHRLRVVTKPPAELVPLREVRRLAGLLDARTRIMAEERIRGYEAVDRAVEALNAEAAVLAAYVVRHAATLRIGWELRERGAELFFLDRLHAKLLWTPAGALLGSANFTGGGLGGNEELMVEITGLEEGLQLADAAQVLQHRATDAGSYDLGPALRQADVRQEEFLAWPDQFAVAGHAALAELLRSLRRALR